LIFEFGGAPASLARNSAAEKRGRAKIPSPQPPSFLPARAKIIKIQRPDFRQKKFEYQSKNTANFQIATFGRLLIEYCVFQLRIQFDKINL